MLLETPVLFLLSERCAVKKYLLTEMTLKIKYVVAADSMI